MAPTSNPLTARYYGVPGWAILGAAVLAGALVRKRLHERAAAAIGTGTPTRSGAYSIPVNLPSRAAPLHLGGGAGVMYAAPAPNPLSASSVIPAPSNALAPLSPAAQQTQAAVAQQEREATAAAYGMNTPQPQTAFNQAGGFGSYVQSLPPTSAAALASLSAARNAPSNPAAVDAFIQANANAAGAGLPHFSHDALDFEGMSIPTQTIAMLDGTIAGQELQAGYLPAWYAAETGTLTSKGAS